ncbi:MAG TPA: DUF2341 domain-containing protein [Candidatus Methanofastidiosum sp.]|jgi:hypothetical protein|nr:DUF2341 domain-containing protein [Methanofastidiosum sp.]
MSTLSNRSRAKKSFFILLILTIFSFTSLTFCLADDPAWWNNDWTYRDKITIANAGSTTLTNFPAYINVPYREGMQSDYKDLRFTNADGTLILDYEIEAYDSTKADIWVRIPEFPVPSVSIWMYYGNKNATSGQNPEGVWDSDYLMVQHLEETSGTCTDSTSNHNDGAPHSVQQNILGKIDGADEFKLDGSYIGFGNNPTFNTPSFVTFESWITTNNNNLTTKIVQKGDWDGHGLGQDKWKGWQSHITLQDKGAKLDWGKGMPQANRWYYLVMTYDGSKMIFYVDGEKVAETDISGNLKITNRNVFIGADGTSQKFFKGIIDEVRISKVARSADWIKQTYFLIKDNPGNIGFVSEKIPEAVIKNITTPKLKVVTIRVGELILADSDRNTGEELAISGEHITKAVYKGNEVSAVRFSKGTHEVTLKVSNFGMLTQRDVNMRVEGLPEGASAVFTPENQIIRTKETVSFNARCIIGSDVPDGVYKYQLILYNQLGVLGQREIYLFVE